MYSCAQPDESSIYSIVNMLHSQGDEALEIIWINLREEPSMFPRISCLSCSFINGVSYVLRKGDEPFQNLFNDESVITKSKVENMEKRLKKDVMNECRVVGNGCNIVVQNEETLHNVVLLSSIHRSYASRFSTSTPRLCSQRGKCSTLSGQGGMTPTTAAFRSSRPIRRPLFR